MNLTIDNKDLWYLSEAVQYRLFTIKRELEDLSDSTAEYDKYEKDTLIENYNRLARLSDKIDKAEDIEDITEDVTKDYIAEQFERGDNDN